MFPASHQHLNFSAAHPPQSGAQPPAKELTKAQKRRRKRQARKSAALEVKPESGVHEMTAPRAETVASRAPSSPPIRYQFIIIQQDNFYFLLASRERSLHAIMDHWPCKAEWTTQEPEGFISIRKIEKGPLSFSVIGVVTSSRPLTQTRSQGRIFAIGAGFSPLVDPSCVEEDIVTYNFKVNCFQNKHKEWLPQAEVGDIVIFRDLKTSDFRGGFNEKDASHSEKSPYYEPQGKEAEYCAKLADWWQAIQAKEQGITVVQCAPRPSREHHLISEVTPDTSPQGYFDCTVEILYSYGSTYGPHTVYVTDYTANPRINPPQANWCSPELSAYVFKMEMWDDAKLLAKMMQPGEFWYLPNARMMMDSYLHLHGKLVETRKTKKLDKVENGENLHFRALLERKKKFEQGEGASKFDTKLIEDVDKEVLHVDLASPGEPLVYVTDYTFNPDLVNPAGPAPWALGLDRRTVKIVLEGGQKRRARDLQPGAMYRIKYLRLIRRAGVKGAFGRLGGDERLIIAVNDPKKKDVQALLQFTQGEVEVSNV
ncbi:hypothetical protein EDB19DRAFT_1915952 [Suillus lakei]|nr:hypothetical protein EDB19DRAFT_1915952 [Suillus lakei]